MGVVSSTLRVGASGTSYQSTFCRVLAATGGYLVEIWMHSCALMPGTAATEFNRIIYLIIGYNARILSRFLRDSCMLCRSGVSHTSGICYSLGVGDIRRSLMHFWGRTFLMETLAGTTVTAFSFLIRLLNIMFAPFDRECVHTYIYRLARYAGFAM